MRYAKPPHDSPKLSWLCCSKHFVRGAGAKLVNALNLGGQALFLLALPAAASLGAVPLAVALTCLGMCQGPLVPAQAVLQRYWMPAGCVSTTATQTTDRPLPPLVAKPRTGAGRR